jgi:hypothetical protein
VALTSAKVSIEAEAAQAVAERFLTVYESIVSLINHSNDQQIDWAAATKPAYIEEDPASGNIAGLMYTRQQVGLAFDTLVAIRQTMTATNLKNLNMIARPTGRR